MKQRHLFSFLFVLFVIAVIAWRAHHPAPTVLDDSRPFRQDFASTSRPAPLTDQLTPEILQDFIQHSQIHSVHDLICSLPESLRQNYVVMHSSSALQSGVPYSPRVILFPPSTDPQVYRNNYPLVLTITGSKLGVEGSNHVEVLFHNLKSRQNELYDINFDHQNPSLEKNPAICMGCHSPDQRELAVAGPKGIFQNFPWVNAVGFSMDVTETDTQVKKYVLQLEGRALHALGTDPNYACLVPPNDISALRARTITYDEVVSDLFDTPRLIQLIQHSKDYKKIRPLFLGVVTPCMPGFDLPPTTDVLNEFEQIFSQWVPSQVANSVFNDDHFIRSNLRQADSPYEILTKLDEQSEMEERTIRQTRESRGNFGTTKALFFPTVVFNELYQDDFSEYHRLMSTYYSSYPHSLSAYSPVTKLFARYRLDTAMEPHFNSGTPSWFRFIFEARGVSTLTWAKEMAGSHGADITLNLETVVNELEKTEQNDPFWQAYDQASNKCEFLRGQSHDHTDW